ncbi:MAG: L-lactate dehydrogenase [Chloroflexota bacterium]
MKVGIVGSGMVGATAAYAMVMRGTVREIVLVDLNRARAQADADDLLHAVPFARPVAVRVGEYSDLSNSKVVIIAAGVGQKPGETRLQLLERNAAVFRQVVPSILTHAPDTILLVATNPVDIMTHLAARYAAEHGVPSHRVLGSGTTLDTARFRAQLGRRLGVDAQHVHAYVLGEHGDSEVFNWSQVTIGGIPLKKFCELYEADVCPDDWSEIEDQVRQAAYRIIEGKGATYYGIGSALARIIEVILRDQRAILTVCTPQDNVLGVRDVTLALPNLVSGNGIHTTLQPSISANEADALRRSAQIIRDAITSLSK